MAQPKIQIDLKQVENLAARGLTNDKIAYAMGFSPRTLYNNKKENAELAEAIARGRSKGEMVVSDVLFDMATSKEKVEVQVVTKKGVEKVTQDKYDERTRLEAAKFWLERRGGWIKKEQTDVDLSSTDGSMSPQGGINVDLSGLSYEQITEIARAAFTGK